QQEPFQDLARSLIEVGTEQSSRLEFAFGVPNQHPTNGQRGLAAVVPNGRAGGDLDQAPVLVAGLLESVYPTVLPYELGRRVFSGPSPRRILPEDLGAWGFRFLGIMASRRAYAKMSIVLALRLTYSMVRCSSCLRECADN